MAIFFLVSILSFIWGVSGWKRALKSIFVLVVLEGVLRKWIFPEASQFVYFLKDIILLGCYLKFFTLTSRVNKKNIRHIPLLEAGIFLVSSYCFFEVWNPALGSFVIGIFGFKTYLLYIPLLWIIPSLFSSVEELENFLKRYLLLVIPVGILGILQFLSPSNSRLNIYAADIAATAFFGEEGFARITGTFSYLSGYGIYLVVSFGLLLCFLAQKHRWRLVFGMALGLLIINSFMTGSRGVIFFEALIMIGYMTFWIMAKPSEISRMLLRLIIPLLVLFILLFPIFQKAYVAFGQRAMNSDSITERIQDSFSSLIKQFFQTKGLGYGCGATHQATPAMRQLMNLSKGDLISITAESEMAKILLELGPIGFVLWYGIRIIILLILWKTIRRLRNPLLQRLCLIAFLIHAVSLPGPLVFNHTFAVYYWFFSSFIYLLPLLDQTKEAQNFG